jgi:hypothetical protein
MTVCATIEELDAKLAEWKADGFNSATLMSGTEFCYYGQWHVMKYGTTERGIVNPWTAGTEPYVYRVEAEKYTREYPGKLGRLIDDGSGKMERRSIVISEELANSLKSMQMVREWARGEL